MSEDLTQNLPPPSFEERVLSELAAIRGELAQQSVRLTSVDERLTSLEDRVDARLRETRPIWEGVQQRLTDIKDSLSELNRQLKTLITDSFKLRVRVEKLEDNQPTA
jgi:chromosome segregation ATPase